MSTNDELIKKFFTGIVRCNLLRRPLTLSIDSRNGNITTPFAINLSITQKCIMLILMDRDAFN